MTALSAVNKLLKCSNPLISLRVLTILAAIRPRDPHHKPSDVSEPSNRRSKTEPVWRVVCVGICHPVSAQDTTLQIPCQLLSGSVCLKNQSMTDLNRRIKKFVFFCIMRQLLSGGMFAGESLLGTLDMTMCILARLGWTQDLRQKRHTRPCQLSCLQGRRCFQQPTRQSTD